MAKLEHDAGRERIIEILERHEVDFIVIGGAASQSRGWEELTQDIDVTPARDPANLTRLASALTALDARFRVDETRYPDGFSPPGGLDARTFRDPVSIAFSTPHGHVDICLIPDGFPRGYDDLRINAEVLPVAQTSRSAQIANADDILYSKFKANRQKDRDMLPRLRAAFERAGSLKASPRANPGDPDD